MTIREIISQGLYYARTCKSLWLFGFFVAIASGSSSGGAGAGADGEAGGAVTVGVGGVGVAIGADLLNLPLTRLALIAVVVVLAVAALVVLRCIGEGALIEGVVRARHGGTMSRREGLRAGWAHAGVLVRIALLYVAATIGSVALLAAAWVIAMMALGPFGGVLIGVSALVIAVPWLVTLYLLQAFAMRVAVLENRYALDAIRKARLFLHGRLHPALKLVVATFVGTLGIVLFGILAIAPLALLLAALTPVARVFPPIVAAWLVLLPPIYVFGGFLGTFRSSIWTIGYVTQVES